MGTEVAEGKVCTRCGVSKPMDDFHRNCSTKDGHLSFCMDCHNAGQRRAWAKRYTRRRPVVMPSDGERFPDLPNLDQHGRFISDAPEDIAACKVELHRRIMLIRGESRRKELASQTGDGTEWTAFLPSRPSVSRGGALPSAPCSVAPHGAILVSFSG